MITLYQFTPVWGLPNASPFCMKLETYLRMAKLPFQIAPHADIRKAPKGKMPYIEDRGKRVADSGFIVDYLIDTYGDKLDAGLADAARAAALGMRRLMEEHLYWCLLYARWIEPRNWAMTKPAYFGFLPPVVRKVLPEIIRKKIIKDLRSQGIGRHRPAEIYALGKADITALSEFLVDKSFFMGDKPSSLDAVAYAFVANILWAPTRSPLTEHAESHDNLSAYCARMKELYYA